MDQIRVVFLGTGAAAPTRERNVSSLAVILDGATLLFDCGEGTQHQIMRSSVRPGSIDAIFITHLHGDHLFGLPGLLASLGLNGRSRDLQLVGPPGLARFIAAIPYRGTPYSISVLESEGGAVYVGLGFRVDAALLEHSVPCLGFSVIEDDRPGTFDVARAAALGVPAGPLFGLLQRGSPVSVGDRVIHPEEVLGSTRPGRRVTFCTDTRPCSASVSLAWRSDVLIHEATYTSDLAAEAASRHHSTAAEAAAVARDADAASLILTHISARYASPAALLAEAAAVFPRVTAASDFIEIVVPAARPPAAS